MLGEKITTVAGRRLLIAVLVLPLLAGCTPFAPLPDKSSLPWRTAGPTPEAAPDGPVSVPAAPPPDVSSPDLPALPPPPTSGPLIIDTSKVTQQVVLKVDRMTKPSWDVHIRGMLKGKGTYTILCRGKGEIMLTLHRAVGDDYGGSGNCDAAESALVFAIGSPAPPDGSMDVSVTAPPGAQWALLVTQPAGT